MSEKKPKHYVNNADFLKALIEYKEKCDEAKKAEKEEPKIPNYVGECFLKIAEHLSRKPNFISYSLNPILSYPIVRLCVEYEFC